jgi:putative restriction endonuclease
MVWGRGRDCGLHVRRDILEELDGPMLRHGLQDLHGGTLILPRRVADRPNREYLAQRFEAFRAA